MANPNISMVDRRHKEIGACVEVKRAQEWNKLQAELDRLIEHRGSRNQKWLAAEPMVRRFCNGCPIVNQCRVAAENDPEYAGVAGAKLFLGKHIVLEFTDDSYAARSA